MVDVKILGAALVLCAVSSIAVAGANQGASKLYKWVDDKGVTHYGEVIPPEYADREKVELEKGREVKKKEKVDDAASGKKKTEEDQAAIDRHRRDKALVNTYSNVKEIDLARDRNLQQVEARVTSIQLLLKTAQENLDNYRKEAEVAGRSGKGVHASLQSDIANAENKVAKLQEDLDKAKEKEASVKASFEADKQRYIELTGRQ